MLFFLLEEKHDVRLFITRSDILNTCDVKETGQYLSLFAPGRQHCFIACGISEISKKLPPQHSKQAWRFLFASFQLDSWVILWSRCAMSSKAFERSSIICCSFRDVSVNFLSLPQNLNVLFGILKHYSPVTVIHYSSLFANCCHLQVARLHQLRGQFLFWNFIFWHHRLPYFVKPMTVSISAKMIQINCSFVHGWCSLIITPFSFMDIIPMTQVNCLL